MSIFGVERLPELVFTYFFHYWRPYSMPFKFVSVFPFLCARLVISVSILFKAYLFLSLKSPSTNIFRASRLLDSWCSVFLIISFFALSLFFLNFISIENILLLRFGRIIQVLLQLLICIFAILFSSIFPSFSIFCFVCSIFCFFISSVGYF